jgi:hypothetical protein
VFNRGAGQAEPFELLVRSYGPGRCVAERLAGHVKAWEAAGRPPVSDVRITMLPIDTPYQSGDNEVVVPK